MCIQYRLTLSAIKSHWCFPSFTKFERTSLLFYFAPAGTTTTRGCCIAYIGCCCCCCCCIAYTGYCSCGCCCCCCMTIICLGRKQQHLHRNAIKVTTPATAATHPTTIPATIPASNELEEHEDGHFPSNASSKRAQFEHASQLSQASQYSSEPHVEWLKHSSLEAEHCDGQVPAPPMASSRKEHQLHPRHRLSLAQYSSDWQSVCAEHEVRLMLEPPHCVGQLPVIESAKIAHNAQS